MKYAWPIQPTTPTPKRNYLPGRRLKVGFVSCDFMGHCQSLYTLPLLKNLNRQECEVFCYGDVPRPDQVTEEVKRRTDHWRRTTGVNDQELGVMVGKDEIDILVDLGMHMGNGRLLAFARKPAAVQVAWLAYPGTTGLEMMDYRLTDPYLDPPGETDQFYSEKSIRLADTFWCFDPVAIDLGTTPQPGELPAIKNGYVTFGCLNNFGKVNEDVLVRWSRVLRETPGSRLRLLAPEGRARQWTVETFGREGVEEGRIEFVGFQDRALYLREYQRIDVGLDTLPYNGHTTSLDSMWMGVPVVNQIGKTVVGRAGWSQLSNLGMTELAARDDDGFVRTAVELATDLTRLAQMRRTLRERILASPLCDAKRFARSMEAAFRQMWTAA